MNEQEYEYLLERLLRKLGLEEAESGCEMLLHEALEEAESEMKLYLNCEQLPAVLHGKLVEMAVISYQHTKCQQTGGMKSASYSEGDTSQSVTYMTAQDVQSAKDTVLKSIAHYRRRATWR